MLLRFIQVLVVWRWHCLWALISTNRWQNSQCRTQLWNLLDCDTTIILPFSFLLFMDLSFSSRLNLFYIDNTFGMILTPRTGAPSKSCSFIWHSIVKGILEWKTKNPLQYISYKNVIGKDPSYWRTEECCTHLRILVTYHIYWQKKFLSDAIYWAY